MAADPPLAGHALPTVVVVGSASRDLTPDDPRGWRLGGGVTYGSLALAPAGHPDRGADRRSTKRRCTLDELELLRSAGVDLMPVPLVHGPVFVNQERPEGRVQTAVQVSDPVPTSALPPAWRSPTRLALRARGGRGARGLGADSRGPHDRRGRLAGTAAMAERRSAGSSSPAVAFRPAGARLTRRSEPSRSARRLCCWTLAAGWLGPQAELMLSAGQRGGLLLRLPGPAGVIRYPAVDAKATIDATGAGDVTLAALLAARLAGGGAVAGAAADWVASRRRHLLFAAAAASLTVEQAGLLGVPDLAAVRQRLLARHAPAKSD